MKPTCAKVGCPWPIHPPYTVCATPQSCSQWCAMHGAESFAMRAEVIIHSGDRAHHARTLLLLRTCPEVIAQALWLDVPAAIRDRIDCSAQIRERAALPEQAVA